MKNSPSICQWYVAHILSPIRKTFPDAIVLHYVDDTLVCSRDQSYLDTVLTKTVKATEDTGFEIHEDKIQ